MLMEDALRVKNAQELIDMGYTAKLPHTILKEKIIREMSSRKEDNDEKYQYLYPNTILETSSLKSLTAALISGANILLFGPPGSGKTNLAKDIWNLMPKEIFYVEGCPVQDDPMSLVDKNFSKNSPPCPICKRRFFEKTEYFDPESVEPKHVPVARGFLREGFGFARVQGSSEVFPDNLTGTLNIHKLEEIGDPMSPLVLEPGKLLQANRGVLIIDEVGKLPVGTQNVLLQALQEKIVTPGKSRETFPANFIAVTTSNLADLENINEPLNDRLSNIYVGFNKEHYKNRMIVSINMEEVPSIIFIPDMMLDAGVYLIEMWRGLTAGDYELSEVGSNRTMIDIVKRMIAYATLSDSWFVNIDALKSGGKDAMLGHIRARGGESFKEDKKIVEEFMKKYLDRAIKASVRSYWCDFYQNILKNDKSEAIRVINELKKAMRMKEINIKEMKKLKKFYEYVMNRERYLGNADRIKSVLEVFKIIEQYEFSCEG